MNAVSREQLWYISFGDLLTLLLSGFLMILSSPGDSLIQESQKNLSSAEVGILVANTPEESFALVAEFSEIKGTLEGGVLSKEAINELRTIAESGRYLNHAIAIEACLSSTEGETRRKAFSLSRQVIDVIGGKASLSALWVESRCPSNTFRVLAS